ncbi:MAG: hypothetical protein MUE54_15065, partial [Anaerolineae bacterium]|nr:hypothetical protein [Anaerolineae bacterium]
MINQPTFTSHSIITLPHNGLCGILGITPQFDLYTEEIYPPDDDVIHHHIHPNGTMLHSAENLTLPSDCISPKIHANLVMLNYSGGRLRGMREAERLIEWARPFSIAEKMTLIEAL